MAQLGGQRALRAAEALVAADRWHEAAAAYVMAIRTLADGSGGAEDRRAARGLSFALAQLCAAGTLAERIGALEQAVGMLPADAHYAHAVLLGDMGAWHSRAGSFPPALACLRRAVALDPSAPGVVENLQHVLSSAVQRWHFRMLNDSRRNAAYESSIRAALAELPSARVLDIGTGTGLLAMLAARAGAQHVWACDCVPVMTQLARECTAANGLGPDRVTVVDAMSTSMTVGEAGSGVSGEATVLPQRVDLVVTEILDAGLLGEHILPPLRHAREHLLVPGGRTIPCGATVFAACVASPDLRRKLHVSDASATAVSQLLFPSHAGGIAEALGPIRSAVGLDCGESYDTTWLHRLRHCQFLTQPTAVLEIDFAAERGALPENRTALEATAEGCVDAVVSWFTLHLDATHSLSTGPEASDDGNSCWEQAVYPVGEALGTVSCGDELALQSSCTESSLCFRLQRTAEAPAGQLGDQGTAMPRLHVGEAAVRKLNHANLHRSFAEAVAAAAKAATSTKGGQAVAVLDTCGDWACSAAVALRHASYVLATHVSEAPQLADQQDTAGEPAGAWRKVLEKAAASGESPARRLDTYSAGMGELLGAGWEMPAAAAPGPAGFDVIVTELVDCMGVLREGVLDDLQLAIRLNQGGAVPPRLVPAKAVVMAQLISCPELRVETELRVAEGHAGTCGLDVSGINAFSIESYMDLDLSTMAHTALSAPFSPFEIALQEAADVCCSEAGAAHGEAQDVGWQRLLFPSVTATCVACADGECDAIAFWFDLHFAGGGSLSTGPAGGEESHWRQAATVLPAACRPSVREGDTVAVHGTVVDSVVRFDIK